MVRLPLVLALALAAAPASAKTLDQLVDPRPTSRVLDVMDVLTPEDRAAIDAIPIDRGDLVVVVSDTVHGQVPRAYATSLFNTWGIGTQADNTGVLLFIAIDDRKAEIVFGDGLKPSWEMVTDVIMEDVVVTSMKRGAPRTAIVDGARAIADRVLTKHPGVVDRLRANPTVGPVIEGARENPVPAGLAAVVPLGLLGLVGRAVNRRRPRKCGDCGEKAERLGELADDKHLTDGERTEERIGSVDYDVWACLACGSTQKLRYGAIFTSYSACGGCRAKAVRTKTRTLQAATQHSTGLAEVHENCEHCKRERTYTRTIPRRPPPSTSSSSSGRSGGGSSSGRGSSGSW